MRSLTGPHASRDGAKPNQIAIRIPTDQKAKKEVMDAFQLEHQRERPDFFMAFSGYVHPVNVRGEYMDHFFLIGIAFGTEWPRIHARLERIADIELVEYHAAFP